MSERLDWLRAELLDRRWRADAPPEPSVPRAASALPASDEPIAWCARLLEIALARYGERAALTRLVGELGRLTGLCFACGGAPAAEPAQVAARLEELIAQIEDLADAAELAEGRR